MICGTPDHVKWYSYLPVLTQAQRVVFLEVVQDLSWPPPPSPLFSPVSRLYTNFTFTVSPWRWGFSQANKIGPYHLLHTWGTRNLTLHSFHYCNYDVYTITCSKWHYITVSITVWLMWRDLNCRTIFNKLHSKWSWQKYKRRLQKWQSDFSIKSALNDERLFDVILPNINRKI